jgi:hypothetical protein
MQARQLKQRDNGRNISQKWTRMIDKITLAAVPGPRENFKWKVLIAGVI